jgi:FkbM family methyltransferase
MFKNIFKAFYKIIPFKLQLFTLVKSVIAVPEKIYRHLHFKGNVTIYIDKEKKQSFKLYSDGERIENEIFWGGIDSWYEKVSMQYWVKLCKNSEVVFDIGAYHGIYSLVAGAVNKQNKIYAFEPVEDSYNKLQRNISLNDFSIKAFKYGASDKDGDAEFYNIDAAGSLIGSLNKESFQHGEKLVKHHIKVRSLASIMHEFNIPKVNLIKIDVEGHEFEVMQGLESYLKEFKPSILFELTEDAHAEKIHNLVKDCGYLYFDIDEVNPPKRISVIKKSSYFNILICTPEIAEKINLI